MGIHIRAKTASFALAYSTWHVVRDVIFAKSFEFLKSLTKVDTNDEESEDAVFNQNVDRLQDLLARYNSFHDSDNDFANSLTVDDVDLLVYFNVYGAFVLLRKKDNEGYYSVGNSHDILLCIKTIDYLLCDEDESSMHKYIKDEVRDVFAESVSTDTIVTIG